MKHRRPNQLFNIRRRRLLVAAVLLANGALALYALGASDAPAAAPAAAAEAASFAVDGFRISPAEVPCDAAEATSSVARGAAASGGGRWGYCNCLLACQKDDACVAFSQAHDSEACRLYSGARAWSCPGVDSLDGAPRWISGVKLHDEEKSGGGGAVATICLESAAYDAAPPRANGTSWGAFVVHSDGDAEARSLQTIVGLRSVLGRARHRSIFLVDCSTSGAFRRGVHATAALGLTAILVPTLNDASCAGPYFGRALNFVADEAVAKELDAYAVVRSGAVLLPCSPSHNLADAIGRVLAARAALTPNWAALHLVGHRVALFSTRATAQLRWDARIVDAATLHCDMYFRLAAVEYAVLSHALCAARDDGNGASGDGDSGAGVAPPPAWTYALRRDEAYAESLSWWELHAAQQQRSSAAAAAAAEDDGADAVEEDDAAAVQSNAWVAEKWGLPPPPDGVELCRACRGGQCHCAKHWPACASFTTCATGATGNAASCAAIGPPSCFAKHIAWAQLRCTRDAVLHALQQPGARVSTEDGVPPAFAAPGSAAESATLLFIDAPMSVGGVADDGGVLWASLARWGGGRVIDRSRDFLALAPRAQNAAAAVWGHFGYGAHLQPRFRGDVDRIRYIAVLRDPFERVADLYRAYASHGVAEPVATWLTRAAAEPPAPRRAAWHPTGSAVARLLCCWSSEFDSTPLENNDAFDAPSCPVDVVSCAKERIRSGEVVIGIAEEMAMTLRRFEHAFGVPFAALHESAAAAATLLAPVAPGHHTELSANDRDAIERHNIGDTVLYEFARKLFLSGDEVGASEGAAEEVGRHPARVAAKKMKKKRRAPRSQQQRRRARRGQETPAQRRKRRREQQRLRHKKRNRSRRGGKRKMV